MDWPEGRDRGRLAARQDRTLDAIVAYRYMAPAYLAYEEQRDRDLAAVRQERALEGV